MRARSAGSLVIALLGVAAAACGDHGGGAVDAGGDAAVDAAVGPDASATAQLQAARDAADGSGLALPVDGAVVTYVQPAVGGEPAGFTLQAAALGPALFVAVDPATLAPPPTVGDTIGCTITAM